MLERLTKDQEASARDVIARMQKYNLADDDGVLDDMIFEMKKNEAQFIIQRGLEEQARYIFSRVGGDKLREQHDAIDQMLMDFAAEGDVVECSKCRKQLFKDKAILDGQNWFCQCCKD